MYEAAPFKRNSIHHWRPRASAVVQLLVRFNRQKRLKFWIRSVVEVDWALIMFLNNGEYMKEFKMTHTRKLLVSVPPGPLYHVDTVFYRSGPTIKKIKN